MKIKLVCLFAMVAASAWAVSIPTAQTDNNRGSYQSAETILTPTLVQGATFGLAGQYFVDGAVYAQPLYVPCTIAAVSHNCLIVATMHDTVYAFDADKPNTNPFWFTSLGTSLTSFITTSQFFYGSEVGALSTPVVDVGNNKIYVVSTNSSATWMLTVINLSTGAIVGSQITLSGQVVGTGDKTGPVADLTSGANLLFYATYELQRSPLLLVGTKLFIAFAAWDDQHPWHGWVMAYDVSGTPTQTAIFCASPNGYGGGIWESAGGPSDDGTYMYVATGNGDYDGVSAWGMSILKLSASLTVSDWWTPSNYATLNSQDADLSSGRIMIIPSTIYLTFGSKDFYVRLIDSTNMGHLSSSPTQQFLTNPSPPTPGPGTGIYGGAYGNGQGFFPNNGGFLYGFSFSGSAYNTTPVVTSAAFGNNPALTISSNNGATPILWAITSASSAYSTARAGILRALNPATMAEYWNSGAGSNDLGTLVKFNSPTVANGNVYVGTINNRVQVYGTLTFPANATARFNMNGVAIQ